jgi:N-acetylglucosaminyl-diphospho-decaprenol L-rhamnosyltransferase
LSTTTVLPRFSLSIVSHGQSGLIAALLADLESVTPRDFEVILTFNIPEPEPTIDACSFPIQVIRNSRPKGFGANHNQAFRAARGELFAVINPDIRMQALNLAALASPFADAQIGACGPLVVDSSHRLQDSARRFPTLGTMLRRLVKQRHVADYSWQTNPIVVDWLAGMFVVFRPSAFEQVGGFDERRFFMYYEDVDIAMRLGRHGWRSVLQPAAQVIHDAQRASHRDPKHLRWHVVSAARYLTGL